MCRIPLPTIILIAILIIHTALAICGSFTTNDDAFISFRYARNLVTGHGLVFNPGERVEGYTNFLWIMLLAAAWPVANPIVMSKIFGVLCSLLLLISFYRFASVRNRFWAVFAVLYLALDPSLIDWSTRGLETPLFTLMIWLSFHLAAQPTAGGRTNCSLAALFAALALLTRPEGFFATLLFFPACRTHRKDRKSLQIFLATLSGIILPYLLWKLWYFHQLLPNTFYAKTGGDTYVFWRGAAYIIQGWGVSETLLFLIAITGVITTFHRHSVMNRRNDIPLSDAKTVSERRVRAVALGFTFVFLIYILAVGGDSLGRDRFLTPLLPFVLAAAISSAAGLPKQQSAPLRFGLALLFCGILIGNSLGLTDRIRNPDVYSYRKELNHPGTRTGRCLAEHAGHRDTIATSIIGRIPYYSGLRTFDVFGLIDPFIARQQSDAIGSGAAGHEKSDWSYILSLKPLYITGQELIAAPPAEPDWLRALRLRIHGDRAGRQIGIPAPPYPGYSRVELICGESTIRIWKRTPELLMEMDEQGNGRAE